MAYVFELGVNCSDEDGAVEMVNYLGAAGGALDFGVSCGTVMEDGDWWAFAVPSDPETGDHLWRSGGPASAEDAARMGGSGRALYRLLEAGPHFRYATVGIEATSGMTCAELTRSLRRDRSGWPGLVMARPVWKEAGSPPGFVNFSDGYLWVPYEGERFRV